MNSRLSTTLRRLLLVPIGLILLAGGVATAVAGAPASDINPDRVLDTTGANVDPGGRVVGLAVDPNNPLHAWALAENAGVFGTHNGGASWEGNVKPNGTPGSFGQGLAQSGVTKFDDIAVDPGSPNVLLLLADDDHRATNGRQGVWRSDNGGASWIHIASPPCPMQYAASGEGTYDGAHVRFSPQGTGWAFATTPCGLGASSDGGRTWSWPIAGDPTTLSGLDVYAGSKATKKPSGDLVAVCGIGRISGSPAAAVGLWRQGTGISWYALPGGSDASSGCSVAFSPLTSSTLYLTVRNGGAAHVYEGAVGAGPITWTDLEGPAAGASNGRPVIVATHRDGAGYRLYYANTTLFSWEECTSSCPVASTPSTNGCGDLPWHCLAYFHPDYSALVFDPSRPDQACPLLSAGDGGVTGETSCGDNHPVDGHPLNVGLHALQPYTVARSGDGEVFLPTQDNWALRLRGGTWRADGLGDATDADAYGDAVYIVTNNAGLRTVTGYPQEETNWPWRDNPRTTSVSVPTPPGTAPPPELIRFVDALTMATPVVARAVVKGAPRYVLRIATWRIGTTTRWVQSSAGITISDSGAACCGDFAVGGRAQAAGLPRRFYAIVAHSGDSLARTLYCLENGSWRQATGVTDPVAVWSSPSAASWTYVWDTELQSLLVEQRDSCSFVPATAPSTLITSAGLYGDPTDPGSRRWLVSAIGFDPDRPGRALIATRHSGVLVTGDGGKTWTVSHAFPEPNGGITGFTVSDSGIATGAVEPVYTAGWGRGLWEIAYPFPRERYFGLPQARMTHDRGFFGVTLTCSYDTACAGSVDLTAYTGTIDSRRTIELGTQPVRVSPHSQAIVNFRIPPLVAAEIGHAHAATGRTTAVLDGGSGRLWTTTRIVVLD